MFTDTMFSTILSRQQNKAAQILCTELRAFTMKKESEAHEALSLLFHRDEAPNVMVMDGYKAQTEEKFRRKLRDTGYHIKQTQKATHNPPTWVKGSARVEKRRMTTNATLWLPQATLG
jgi:hypothetical protein